jgi:hypothetical protein
MKRTKEAQENQMFFARETMGEKGCKIDRVCLHVQSSNNGMSSHVYMRVLLKDGNTYCPCYAIATIKGGKLTKDHQAITIGGCGFNKAHAAIETLADMLCDTYQDTLALANQLYNNKIEL